MSESFRPLLRPIFARVRNAAALLGAIGAAAAAVLSVLLIGGERRSGEVPTQNGEPQSSAVHVGEIADQASEGAIVETAAFNKNQSHPPIPSRSESSKFRPAALYDRYLEQAIADESDAQYVLVTALLDCFNVARTEAELDIDRLERSGLPREFIYAARQRVERCSPLHEALPDIQAEYLRWYTAASSAGHPLILLKRKGIPVEERTELLKQAVTAPYPEPHLHAEAFLAAAQFDRTEPAHLNRHREEAWLLLYCEASFQCDAEEERKALRKKYHTHDYDQIVGMESDIRGAIARRDWVKLGL